MHHRLIADLSLEILSLKILNKIFALIRIVHLDYTLSAGKKIISQLVLCLGRAWLARQSALDRAHRRSRRSGFALLALRVRLLTKIEAATTYLTHLYHSRYCAWSLTFLIWLIQSTAEFQKGKKGRLSESPRRTHSVRSCRAGRAVTKQRDTPSFLGSPVQWSPVQQVLELPWGWWSQTMLWMNVVDLSLSPR